MEEKNNMTAERSLEIIRESIERSRKAVSADAGTTLLISGLCIVGVATVVAVGHLLTKSWVFYLLYMLIPIFIWAINGYRLKSKWMVWCGIIGGLGGYFWQAFCVTETLAANTNMGALYVIIPNLMMAVFTFIGLTLPGWMLVRNKK